jgi:hypothetical protein
MGLTACRGPAPRPCPSTRTPTRGAPPTHAASRTRLRKLREATAASAAAAANAERSPHAKESYDASDFPRLAEVGRATGPH